MSKENPNINYLLDSAYKAIKLKNFNGAKIFFKKIIASLNDGNTIEIRGFGTIKKKINKEKQVRNPKNNQLLYKNKTYKLHFKIGKTLHKKLNHII